jgi:ParB family chromosome partitioning protein
MTAMTPVRAARLAGERKLIPLDKLFVSRLNVRKHGSKAVETLAASIAAQGQLQPLLVRPSDKKFEVIFGQRRLLAMQKLKAAKHPGAGMAECIVRDMDDAAAIEASLAENIERLPMDVMDQYEAFAALAARGQDEDSIASHFGITRQVVKRRLALGNLIPDIRKLYRAEQLEEKELQLLTLASRDKQKEYAALASDPEGNPPPFWQLKAWLLGGAEIPVTAALFDADASKLAIAADLFGGRRYFTDPTAFWNLQNAAIAARKAELEASGWAVDLLDPQNPFRDWQYEKLAKDKGGRVVIAVSPNGEVAIHKGVIHQDELARLQKAKGKGKSRHPESRTDDEAITEDAADTANAAERPELTEPLSNYIELVRHSTVRAALTTAPATALRIAAAQLIAGSTHWHISPEPRAPQNDAVAKATRELAADAGFRAAQAEAQKLLGKKAAEAAHADGRIVSHHAYDHSRTLTVYRRLTELDDAAVMKLLTIAVAETLASGTGLIDAVGTDLKVDVLMDWHPGEDLFGLIRDKETLSAMVEEVAGKPTAVSNLTATGTRKKEVIQNALTGKGRPKVEGWQPRWMAFPQGQYTKRRLTQRAKPGA